ncbi:MAG: 3-hydroxyacyl-CoA dehydrogenase NAD-binding domain-containing protein, partial [Vicinamibacterales bacterium]
MTIRSVAVLGAGTMGAQIAAHFANAGVPALLLDLTLEAAREGLQRARATKPDPFFTPDTWKLITLGSFDADLGRIADANWIVEAVVERLDVKRALLERVDAVRRPGSIVTSNTSGISITALAEGRSDDFRRHWLGTHFFNPPRYLRLLELIPTPESEPAVVEAVRHFADHRLGKGVVPAKDSPGFIGNHIGMFGLLRLLDTVVSGDYTIEEVDAITGPALGRPRSATFRTLDLAGLDIVAHVVRDMHERLPAPARDAFVLPPLVERMLDKGLTGEKAGGGFYKRVKRPNGESEILVLDLATFDYKPQQKPRLAALDAAASLTDVRERVKALFEGKDRVGAFLQRTLEPTIRYAAQITPDVAYSPDDVDRVMRWGFGWELGPFELADSLGITTGVTVLRPSRERPPVVRKNAGASLVDLGDGVLCVEFHSKMNT